MKKERKICLQFYKIAYSLFFVVILSVIRGVYSSYEVGIALEGPMAVLAMAICADTYAQEITSRRSEILRLCPLKNRTAMIIRRMLLQEIYLLLLAAVGYGMFFMFQRPFLYYDAGLGTGGELPAFLVYLGAVAVTLNFWGILSNTLSCLLRNLWAGIGGCFILWVFTNSTLGDCILGKWNLFSYSFRNVEDSGDFGWICGKLVCIFLILIMAAMLPQIVKKRG